MGTSAYIFLLTKDQVLWASVTFVIQPRARNTLQRPSHSSQTLRTAFALLTTEISSMRQSCESFSTRRRIAMSTPIVTVSCMANYI